MTQKDKNQKYPLLCPLCGAKANIKVREDTILLKFPFYCKSCKKESLINVVKWKIVLADESEKHEEETNQESQTLEE